MENEKGILFIQAYINYYLFISAENIKVFVAKIRHRILQPSNLGFFLTCTSQL